MNGVIFVSGYLAAGFGFFFLTLIVDRIFKFDLFVTEPDGEKVKWPTPGVFIVLIWPVVMPLLALAGLAVFIYWFCGLFIKEKENNT